MPKLIPRMSLRSIAALPPGLHAVAPSLYLAIGKAAEGKPGSRSWIFRYVANGKKRDYGIGSCRDLSRDDAEREVARLRELRRCGIDPIDQRRTGKLGKAIGAPTFKQAVIEFHKAKAVAWSESHARGWLKEMERETLKALGAMRVDQITVADILRCLEAAWVERHETASRCRGRIEQVLDRCKVLGHRGGENPARWRGNLDALLPSPKAVKAGREAHHAAVGFDRVPALVAKLRERETECGRALELLILTAARSGEISGARWSEIDLDAREWRLPAERMKARKPHVVPLGERAMAILETQPRRGDDFVFDLGRDDLRDCLQAIDPNATVHGLRSDFSTWAGERTNFARDVVEQCLAHLVGNAVERSYRRGEEIEKRRRVLNAWERFMVNGHINKGKIVDIKAA